MRHRGDGLGPLLHSSRRLVEKARASFLLPRQSNAAAALNPGRFRLDHRGHGTGRDVAPRPELLFLLERFRLMEATRQRDNVFARFGLAEDGKHFTPDYAASLPQIITLFGGVLEIFRTVAEVYASISEDKVSEILPIAATASRGMWRGRESPRLFPGSRALP